MSQDAQNWQYYWGKKHVRTLIVRIPIALAAFRFSPMSSRNTVWFGVHRSWASTSSNIPFSGFLIPLLQDSTIWNVLNHFMATNDYSDSNINALHYKLFKIVYKFLYNLNWGYIRIFTVSKSERSKGQIDSVLSSFSQKLFVRTAVFSPSARMQAMASAIAACNWAGPSRHEISGRNSGSFASPNWNRVQ